MSRARYEAVTQVTQVRQVWTNIVAGVVRIIKEIEGLRLAGGSDVGVCAELNSAP